MTWMKHIVITGATRGLGRALAVEFASAGWTVSACGTDASALDTLRGIIGAHHGLMTCDVTCPQSVREFARAACDRHGAPDLLLNNAAIIHKKDPLWKLSPEEFSRVIDVNLKGVHYVIHSFAPAMISRGRGVIVNFSSGWGRSVSPEVAAYCATKWGIEGLTAALAMELPRDMAAVAFNPGIIDTRMLRSCFGPDASNFPTPDEWAVRAAPFLRSLGAGHNGMSLTVPEAGD